jgi:hypothetical protein
MGGRRLLTLKACQLIEASTEASENFLNCFSFAQKPRGLLREPAEAICQHSNFPAPTMLRSGQTNLRDVNCHEVDPHATSAQLPKTGLLDSWQTRQQGATDAPASLLRRADECTR